MAKYYNESTPLPSQTPDAGHNCSTDEQLLTLTLMALLLLTLICLVIVSLLYMRLYFQSKRSAARSAARRPNTLDLGRTAKGTMTLSNQQKLQKAHSLPAIERIHMAIDLPPLHTARQQSVELSSYEDIIPNSGIPASTVKGVLKHRWSTEDGYVNEFDMPPCPYTARTAVNKLLPLSLPKPLAKRGWSIDD